jgi:hypothetical protein
MKIFILWHNHKSSSNNEDEKLIGVYSTRRKALRAKSRTSKLKGFRRSIKGFTIDEYVVDKDNWQEGFVTLKQSAA